MAPRHGSSTSSTKRLLAPRYRSRRQARGRMRAPPRSPALPETNGQPAAQMMPVDENDADNMMSATRPCVAFSAVLAPCVRDQSMLRNPTSRASPCLESAPALKSPSCITLRPASPLDVDLQCPVSNSIICEGDALVQLPCRHVLLRSATTQLLSSWWCPTCPVCFRKCERPEYDFDALEPVAQSACAAPSVAWPQSATSHAGVNQRIAKRCGAAPSASSPPPAAAFSSIIG